MKNKIFITALIAALIAGAGGFGAGYATSSRGVSLETSVEAKEQGTALASLDSRESSKETGEAVQASTEVSAEVSTEASKVPSAEKEETEAKEETSSTAASSASTQEPLSDKDLTYDVGDHGQLTKSTTDPAFLANPTLAEAALPDGVASTLYGKEHDDAKMQIVVLGDSQFGNFKGENGIAYQLSQKCKANVYNLAIGGTAASVDANSGTNDEGWDSIAGVGIAKAIAGDISPDFFQKWTYTYEVFQSCDFSKTDLFIIEYGVNDFFQKSPLYDPNVRLNMKTVEGALDVAVARLHEKYPAARVILCTPGYTQFFESGTGAFLGDIHSLSNGVGTLYDYLEFVVHASEDSGNFCYNINMCDQLGIDATNAQEMLMDGIHYTDAGRERYATLLSRWVLRAMGYSIPEDTDPDDVDWASQTPMDMNQVVQAMDVEETDPEVQEILNNPEYLKLMEYMKQATGGM